MKDKIVIGFFIFLWLALATNYMFAAGVLLCTDGTSSLRTVAVVGILLTIITVSYNLGKYKNENPI